MFSIMFLYYEKMCKYLGLYYFNIIVENCYYDIIQEEEKSDILVCCDLQVKYFCFFVNDKKNYCIWMFLKMCILVF